MAVPPTRGIIHLVHTGERAAGRGRRWTPGGRSPPQPPSVFRRRPLWAAMYRAGRHLEGKLMERLDKIRLDRRDMLKLSAGGAGLFALTASGFAVPRGFGSGGGSVYIEAFPTSPLILKPFDDKLVIPPAMAASDPVKE